MAAHLVQEAHVAAHELKDFGRIRAIRTLALDIDQPPQLVSR